jgi:type I restriction enzyme, S subunit
VKPGYKQTEVGVIPEEWEVAPIRQKGEVLTGKALAVEAPGKKRPYLRTKNVFDGRIDIDDVLTMPMTDEQFAQFQIRNGDVLLNEGQSIELVGRCAMYQDEYPEPCAIQNALLRFRARAGVSEKFASYLFRYCQHTGVFARIALQTTSVAHLGGSRFEKLRLAWPTEPEQRAIAEALSDVDGLLGGLDRLIAKKRDLKQAAMQQLLTGQTRLPGFHGEWEVKRLKQVAEISTGINKPLSEMGSGALYVTVQDLYDKTSIRTERLSRIKVSPSEIETRGLIVGDIVFGKSSVKRDGIGYPSQFLGCDEPVVFSGFTYRARARQGITDATFLFYALREEKTRRWLIDNSQASALTNINQTIADAIPVQLPPSVPEQTAIATVLSEMDGELAVLEERREKTRALKQAMMQELLTGRTRLV